MPATSLYHTFKRYRTLRSDVISALPIIILMPHSACNCRCVMCDIWKDNQHLKQLTEKDLEGLLESLDKFGTQQVLMSGGEALLNSQFFRLCEILQSRNIRVSLLSTGLTLRKNCEGITRWVDDVIVSLDGDETTHDRIRNIPGAFQKLKEGVRLIKEKDPLFRITGRSVIHRMNYAQWPLLIDAAKEMGLDQISFLPADVSSQAFNRETPWGDERQHEILLEERELPILKKVIDQILQEYGDDIDSGFIAERADKLRRIYEYYAAHYGYNPFPYKKCNAPWVSAVIEPDGNVRPCFFHESLGNIREQSLKEILNGEKGIRFRKNLDMKTDPTCMKCVCSLHLKPGTNLNANNQHKK